jgi:hypothetical protein
MAGESLRAHRPAPRRARKRIAALCALAVTLAAGLACAARATSLVRMSLPELAHAARAIVRARCLGSEARWEGGEIWTFTRFEPLETLAGTVPRPFVVRLIGGRVGDIASQVEGVPRFLPGEEVILFLEPTRAGDLSLTAWSEGTFRVHRDLRTGRAWVSEDSAAAGVFHPATHRFAPAGVRRMHLALFEQRLRTILGSNAGAGPR